jgi:hypothetical protein
VRIQIFPVSLLCPSHEVKGLLYHLLPSMIYCLATGPKAMGSINHRLKLLKPQAKTNLSSFQVYSLKYFVTVTES